LTSRIRAVIPAGRNNYGQLAQAYFFRLHFLTMLLKNWSKEDTRQETAFRKPPGPRNRVDAS